jgi:penicillin-insensitive murein endopeptidase
MNLLEAYQIVYNLTLRILKLKMLRCLALSLIVLFTFNLDPGSQLKADDSQKTEVIGFYTAGCIENSVELPSEGTGYQVIRLSRKRYYGHPDLIQYLQSLAEDIASRLKGALLIGDLSQRNGGPLPSDHNSHQTGLDADILFWQNPLAIKRTLSWPEREKMEPLSLLTPDFARIDYFRWNSVHGKMLKLAASSEKVDRIFVNPVIKRELCEEYRGEEWLRKIRPWWGHDGHFHVRLRCPNDSPLCEPQEPVPPGDGCDEDLNSWFRLETLREKKDTKPRAPRQLPEQCLAILSR